MGKKCIVIIGVILVVCSLSGCGLFETLAGVNSNKETSFSDVYELESGMAYVWHHTGGSIEEDIENIAEEAVFFTCITGNYNFNKKELDEVDQYPRSIWIDSSTDSQIPTVTSEDYLIYVSKTEVPESIVFERFADYGYTIGISNLLADAGGHYYLTYVDIEEDDYKYYIDLESDAAQLTELSLVEKLYLDKVGIIKIEESTVSDGGTILGLEKDQEYVCEFYTGTYYQDYMLTANIHSFGSMERFVSYEYEFMHSNFIVIQIPDYFVSGYYFVNGVGLFRYVTDEDLLTYNGEAYDATINWNEPMILYNEDGTIQYDPSSVESTESIEELSDAGDMGDVTIDMEIFEDQESSETVNVE